MVLINNEIKVLAFLFPSTAGHQVVLPFPDQEKTFAYTDKDIPILGRFVLRNLLKKFSRLSSPVPGSLGTRTLC